MVVVSDIQETFPFLTENRIYSGKSPVRKEKVQITLIQQNETQKGGKTLQDRGNYTISQIPGTYPIPFLFPPTLSSLELEDPCSSETKEQLFLLGWQRAGLERICEVTKIRHLFPAGVSESKFQGFGRAWKKQASHQDNAGMRNYRSSNLEINQH